MGAFFSLWYFWLLIIIVFATSLFAPQIKGYFGEKSVAFFLSRLDPEKYKIINNVMLQNENKTSQIDHLVVSNYGVFVIETKNYKGWIIGNENDEYWKQVIYKRKEKLFNPIKQNEGHIKALKNALIDYPGINFIPIVAFTTKATLKVNTNSEVVYTINLLRTIKKYNIETITDSLKVGIVNKVISLNINNPDNRKKHAAMIKNNLQEKRNKINYNICPKCGGELVERVGSRGKFKGCRNYPKCRFTVS